MKGRQQPEATSAKCGYMLVGLPGFLSHCCGIALHIVQLFFWRDRLASCRRPSLATWLSSKGRALAKGASNC